MIQNVSDCTSLTILEDISLMKRIHFVSVRGELDAHLPGFIFIS